MNIANIADRRPPRKGAGFATMNVSEFRQTVQEKDTQREVNRLLTKYGWLWMHIEDARRVQGTPGIQDNIGVHPANGCMCVVEVKIPGKYPTAEQRAWANAFARNGHIRVFRTVRHADLDALEDYLRNPLAWDGDDGNGAA